MPFRGVIYSSGGLNEYLAQQGFILFRGVIIWCSGGLYGCSGGLYDEENDYVTSLQSYLG